MVLKMCEYDRKIVCNQPNVSFDGTTREMIIILKNNNNNKTDLMPVILHMPQLIFTVGVESYASKEPQDADYLKPSWLLCFIVNHSAEWITDFL